MKLDIDVHKVMILMGKKGMQAKDLALISGLSQPTIVRVLKTGSCYPKTGGQIAKALDVELELLSLRNK